jgi:Chaperone for flagella basal body P-ring formation
MNMGFIDRHTCAVFFILGVLLVYQGGLPDLQADDRLKKENRIEVFIRDTNLVGSSHILLGDIADIKADGFLKEALEKIDLGVSPKPDKIKSLDKRKIVSAIQSDRSLPKDILITCPDRIYVKRLSGEILVQDIQKFVEQRLKDIFKNKEYKLVTFTVKGLEPYPQGDIQFFSSTEEMVDKNGKLSLFVDIVIDGKKTDKVSVSGLVDLLASPPLIQKGDIVSLFSRNNTLLIVTKGICREDGSENDVIRVENMNSGKIIRGIIKEKSKVEVVY